MKKFILLLFVFGCGADSKTYTFTERFVEKWLSESSDFGGFVLIINDDGLFERAYFEDFGETPPRAEIMLGTYHLLEELGNTGRVRFTTLASTCPDRIDTSLEQDIEFINGTMRVSSGSELMVFDRFEESNAIYSKRFEYGCYYSDGWYPGPVIGF